MIAPARCYYLPPIGQDLGSEVLVLRMEMLILANENHRVEGRGCESGKMLCAYALADGIGVIRAPVTEASWLHCLLSSYGLGLRTPARRKPKGPASKPASSSYK